MKDMKGRLMIAVYVIAALVALSVVKDLVIKVSVEKGVEAATGLKLQMKGFHIGMARGVVSIKDITIFNPAGYSDRVMADMPEIYVDLDIFSVFGGTIHIRKLRINLKEFVVVKNEKGELNINSLKAVKSQKTEPKQPAKPQAKQGKAMAIKIDLFELKAGKAVYKDYTVKGGPSIKEFNVNIDERYTNITNPYELVGLIVVRTLTGTSIAGMANFDMSGLQKSVSAGLATAQQTATKAAATAQKTLEQTAEKTVGSLQEALKNPFGSDKK